MSFSVTNFGKRVDIIFIIKVGITREKCHQLFGGNESCSLFRIILLTIITFLLQKKLALLNRYVKLYLYLALKNSSCIRRDLYKEKSEDYCLLILEQIQRLKSYVCLM